MLYSPCPTIEHGEERMPLFSGEVQYLYPSINSDEPGA